MGEKSLVVGERVEELSVRDAMVKRPKTLPADATVGDLRRLFENAKVRTALLVDGTVFRGAVERDDVSAAADDAAPALSVARDEVQTAAPGEPLAAALERLGATAERRLVVVDGADLAGLLCPNEDASSFCLDA